VECICRDHCSFAKCACCYCKEIKQICERAPTQNDMLYLFGEQLEVTTCFAGYLQTLGVKPGRFEDQLNLWELRTTIVEALEKDSRQHSVFLLDWLGRWQKMNTDGSLTLELSAEHMQKLFRHLLAAGKGGHFFSFCNNAVVEQRRYWHCLECESPGCRNRELGHCDRCGACRRFFSGECESCISDDSD